MGTHIEGLDAVTAKLRLLGNGKLARNAANRAIRQSMKIVLAAARNNAKAIDDPETRESIQKNITYRQARVRSKSFVMGRVGVMGGAAQNQYTDKSALSGLPGGITTYWRFIELGTEHTPAIPFMRIAMFNNISNVTNSFAGQFSAEIDKELAKL